MSAGKKLSSESFDSAAKSDEPDDSAIARARLRGGVIVVDAVAAKLARCLVEFDKLGTISVKGKAIPVDIYTPLRPTTNSVRPVRCVCGIFAQESSIGQTRGSGSV